jgi:predicted ATPase
MVDRIEIDPAEERDPGAWYYGVPAIAQLRDHGVELTGPVTVLVGENGSGKSTFVEALANAWRVRLTAAVEHWGPGRSDDDAALSWAVTITGSDPISHGGCFLRAEAMHRLFGDIDADAVQLRAFGGAALNARSHGESFLAYLQSRLTERGLFILDEPEAALSFTSCLRLLGIIDLLARAGSQVIMATHSPVLAAFPGAQVLEFSPDGIAERAWDELELVLHWQAFLQRPSLYLDPLLATDDADGRDSG